jgi:integrase
VYAQSLRDAGINLGDIQAYMGHSSVELTVRRYAQRGGVEGKGKVNKLADVYNIH